MNRSEYMKEPYLSDKYRKARLRWTTKPWKLMLADKDINVSEAIKRYKAKADPGYKKEG